MQVGGWVGGDIYFGEGQDDGLPDIVIGEEGTLWLCALTVRKSKAAFLIA